MSKKIEFAEVFVEIARSMCDLSRGFEKAGESFIKLSSILVKGDVSLSSEQIELLNDMMANAEKQATGLIVANAKVKQCLFGSAVPN